MALLPDRIHQFHVIDLSNSLFESLQRQFEHVLSPLSTAGGSNGLDLELSSPGGFLQLLRSCIIMLHYLEFDLSLVVEKCRILVHILCRISQCHLPSRGLLRGKDPEGGSPDSLFGAMLEVFIHEFLVHQQLRKHFRMTDYVSATSEKLFVSHQGHDDMNAILELVSSHFLLSVHDERDFSRFIHSLSWSVEVDNEIPEIGPSAALELLGTPVTFSAPHMIQAHLILLASRCIGIHMPVEVRKSDVVVMNNYIKAFEISINLYDRYMSMLDLVDLEDQSSHCAEELAFGSCIRPLICDKLNHQIDKLVSFCRSHSHDMLSGTKADIVNNFIAYIITNKDVIDDLCRNETCLILDYIISAILPGETERKNLHKNGLQIQQEIYCLVVVLKLMSSSLLQILRHLKQNRCQVGMKKDKLFCKEYDIKGIISYFGKYRVSQPIQEVLLNVMGKHHRFEEMKLMLAHFASLLLCSFRRRLGFLWKGCIFMMMTTMNLLIFEEGNLDAFGSLLSNAREDSSPQNSLRESPKDLVHRKSSVIIASNLQKTQMLYIEDQVKFRIYENQSTDSQDSNKTATGADLRRRGESMTKIDPCKGETYFSCLPEYRRNPSEFGDLADFIECKPGKDYSSWLKKRERFREWKHQKRAVSKHLHKNNFAMKLASASMKRSRYVQKQKSSRRDFFF